MYGLGVRVERTPYNYTLGVRPYSVSGTHELDGHIIISWVYGENAHINISLGVRAGLTPL